MKTLLTLSVMAIALQGQSLTLSVTPATVYPGGAATLNVGFTDAATSVSMVGVQYTLTLPSSLTVGIASLGASATAGAKVLTCNGLTCVLVGSGTPVNATALASGALLSIPVTVASAPTLGAASISMTNTLGANTTGGGITIAAAPVTLTILSHYDLNGDGVVNNADVTIALSQADGLTACSSGDVNGDGKCNVQDVVLVILASLGVIH